MGRPAAHRAVHDGRARVSEFLGALGAAQGAIQTVRGVVAEGQMIVGALASGNPLALFAGGGPPPSGLGIWAAALQPASWRGVPFVVLSSTIVRGRRVAIHEYPYRDVVWVEDLGRGVRRITFRGFVNGDDVFAHRNALAAASEQPGPGILVHPSLGQLQVTLTGFSATETFDQGRTVTVDLEFIEGSVLSYPSVDVATQQAVQNSATSAVTGISADFAGVRAALNQGAAVVAQVASTAQAYVGFAMGIIGGAANIADATLGLAGNFGRYSFGSRATPLSAFADADAALAGFVGAATDVTAAAGSFVASVADPEAMAANADALVSSMRATAADPADQVQMMLRLNALAPDLPSFTDPIGAAMTSAASQTVDMVRQTAMVGIARSVADFLPASAQDAADMRDQVSTAMDGAITNAADKFQDNAYAALRDLRQNVLTDLSARSVGLPNLVKITLSSAEPSLVTAYRLYQDTTREPELVQRADPASPAFMPRTFEALSS